MSAASGCRKSLRLFRQSEKKTGGDLPSVLGIEYTLSKTVLGKSAGISENQTATSDGERVMLLSDYLVRRRLVFLIIETTFRNICCTRPISNMCSIINIL